MAKKKRKTGSGRKPATGKRRDSVLLVRFCDSEMKELKRKAKAAGYRYVSTWARDILNATP